MYKELFKSIKEDSLRYMSTGWTRIHPYKNFIEAHSIDAGKYNCSPSDLFMEFGDQLVKILRLRCECKHKDGYEIYRFKLDRVETDGNQLKSQVSIQIGEKIKNIHIYETYEYENLEELNNDEYFPNGLLIEFISGNYLGIWGQEGDDQCEPCHYIKFIPDDEIEIYKIEWMKKWNQYEQIELNRTKYDL